MESIASEKYEPAFDNLGIFLCANDLAFALNLLSSSFYDKSDKLPEGRRLLTLACIVGDIGMGLYIRD